MVREKIQLNREPCSKSREISGLMMRKDNSSSPRICAGLDSANFKSVERKSFTDIVRGGVTRQQNTIYVKREIISGNASWLSNSLLRKVNHKGGISLVRGF